MSDLIPYLNAISLERDTSLEVYYHYPDRSTIDQAKIDNTLVEIVKSFKNSSGFYKINTILENHGAIILSDIQIIKYYKTPSVNDTTLVCYEQTIVDCEYKYSDNRLPSKRFFLIMPPPAPPPSEASIKFN